VRLFSVVEKVDTDAGDIQARDDAAGVVNAQIWSVPQHAETLLVLLQVINGMSRVERKPRLALVEGMH